MQVVDGSQELRAVYAFEEHLRKLDVDDVGNLVLLEESLNILGRVVGVRGCGGSWPDINSWWTGFVRVVRVLSHRHDPSEADDGHGVEDDLECPVSKSRRTMNA